MTDPQLQARRGLNVGVEPFGSFVIDKGFQNKFRVQGNAEVVILQHSPSSNRLVVGKKKEGWYIYGFCPGADGLDFSAFWENAFGERIALDPTPNSISGGNGGLQLVGFNQFGFDGGDNNDAVGVMTLAPGEKLIIKGDGGDGTFFIPTYDVKRKPNPSGGGGATDGNVVTVRGTVTPSGIDFQPPPGKAWAALAGAVGFRASTKVAHFGAIGDTPADVAQYLVDEDGVEYFISLLSDEDTSSSPPFPPQSFRAIGVFDSGGNTGSFWASTGGLLAYPNKYRLKLVKYDDGEDPPFAFPQGRIQFLGTFQEFDLPSDAQL